MKKILFDGLVTQGTRERKFSGGSDYAKFYLKEAIRRSYPFDLVLSSEKITDPEIEEILSKSSFVNVIYVRDQGDVLKLLANNQYDRFYSALPAKYADYEGDTEILGVIHGLRNIELPWDYYRYKYEKNIVFKFRSFIISNSNFLQKYLQNKHLANTKKLLNNPKFKFIVVSKHTRASISAFFPSIDFGDIKVIYSPFTLPELDNIRSSEQKFLLIVNGDRFEKNTYRTIKVLDELYNEGKLRDYKVKITGGQNIAFKGEICNKDKFEFLDYVTTDELHELYKNAYCLLYFSLNEGFGYPPLLAMHCGTPVLASAATSIPEVCADAALYATPNSFSEMKNRIIQLLNDNDLRMNLINKGYARVKYLYAEQCKRMDNDLKTIFE